MGPLTKLFCLNTYWNHIRTILESISCVNKYVKKALLTIADGLQKPFNKNKFCFVEIYRYRYCYRTRIGTIIENISVVSNVKYFLKNLNKYRYFLRFLVAQKISPSTFWFRILPVLGTRFFFGRLRISAPAIIAQNWNHFVIGLHKILY